MKQIFKELQTMYAGTKGIEEYIASLEKALHSNKLIIGISYFNSRILETT